MTTARAVTALGIDYGRRNIGIAVGQTLTQSAQALAVLRYSETRNSRRDMHRQLAALIAEWKPAILVVGWPLNMDGSDSDLCSEVKDFATEVEKQSGLPVCFVDERLTSREAKQHVRSENYRKQPVDSEAARILLESWLRENAT